MAHYAVLDENNIVIRVFVGKDENEDETNWEEFYSNFYNKPVKRTSYNTYGNQHAMGGIPFRKNYAAIGYEYNSVKDAFIPPKPYASWILSEEKCIWEAPVAQPTDGKDYIWDEENLIWKEFILDE